MPAVVYEPVGVIHTPFADPEGMPIQPAGAEGITGTVTIFPEFVAGLKDLGGFSHLILIYHFNRSTGFAHHVVPFLDTTPRGVFATRAPRRPNPIGLSIVRLISIAGSELVVANVDILDETPLLDIKPYVPAFDAPNDVRSGWLETAQHAATQRSADRRFQP